MKVYDIEISGIDLSPKTFSILAEDLEHASIHAYNMMKAKQEHGWEDAELIRVELNCEITKPEQFLAEVKQEEKEQQPK